MSMQSHKKRAEKAESHPLPSIPDKLYFTIGQVSELCDLKPHVLRYWEQEFPQLKPMKRRGNRRYYQQKDVVMIRKIKELLYEEGFTIEGARQRLSQLKITTTSIKKNPVNQAVNKLEDLLIELKEE